MNGWTCTTQLDGHSNEVKCIAWNANGTLLATCARDKSVWVWECELPDANSRTLEVDCLAILQGHIGDVKCVVLALSHGEWGDGDDIVLSSSYDNTIKVWAEDTGDWYCAATLSAHSSTVWSLAMAPSEIRMVSGSADRSLAIWKCYTSEEKKHLNVSINIGTPNVHWKCIGTLPSAHTLPILSVAYSSSTKECFASAGGDDCIRIYKEVGGSLDQPLFVVDASVSNAHTMDINCIQWNPLDDTMLASVGDDGLLKVWRYT